jgi:hypothetical protein
MAAYTLVNGIIQEAHAGCVPKEGAEIFHLRSGGDLTPVTIVPDLKPGEGLLMRTDNFYVEPLEIQADYLKCTDAKHWLIYLALRHIERARYIDDRLWVLAEIMEEII